VEPSLTIQYNTTLLPSSEKWAYWRLPAKSQKMQSDLAVWIHCNKGVVDCVEGACGIPADTCSGRRGTKNTIN